MLQYRQASPLLVCRCFLMLRSLLNQRLGRYFIKELLGRGGMAAVYRAADTVLQRDIALKVLYPQYSDDASLIERFKREAVTAASLEHPSIVPVYDVGEQDGMAYIAMKLLSGRTLQDRLQEAGSIRLEELIAVLTPVAAALDYAHGRGVIHRDIKPGNIFLSQEVDGAHPLLTDFGIAKQLDTPGLTTTGALIGTPDYMAPEQIAGRPIDARVDVYALGMLAFRSLTGRRAFEGSTQDVLLGHLYGHAPLVSELNPAVPPGIDDVVAGAIAADPADRFPSAGAFVAALRQVAHGATVATAIGAARAGAAARTGAGAGATSPTSSVATPPPVTSPPRVFAPPTAPAPSPRTTAQQAGARSPNVAPPHGEIIAPPRRGGAGPWLLSVALALVAGGLAVALAFAIRSQSGTGGGTPAPPPP
ncbi:MAG: serine/threonine protein kinase, partial [Chloroflexales bacterium]|nr:serine/threonine protein kinase [Chloroflexales bacterium]